MAGFLNTFHSKLADALRVRSDPARFTMLPKQLRWSTCGQLHFLSTRKFTNQKKISFPRGFKDRQPLRNEGGIKAQERKRLSCHITEHSNTLSALHSSKYYWTAHQFYSFLKRLAPFQRTGRWKDNTNDPNEIHRSPRHLPWKVMRKYNCWSIPRLKSKS